MDISIDKMKISSRFLWMCLLTTSLIALPLFAQEQAIIIPDSVKQEIIIDGKLNESVWQENALNSKMHDENGDYYTTKGYFTYDADDIYIGLVCKTTSSPEVITHFDKDNQFMLTHDWVAFCIDSYNDGINAFTFIVDAAGNMLDGSLNPPTRDLSFSFSCKWNSAVTLNKDGYIVEMKIPLERLPIQWHKKGTTMAVQIIRNEKQQNRMTQWPATTNIREFQKIVLQGIHQTNPQNLSGVTIADRLAYKKAKINVTSLLGRCQGGDASIMDYHLFKRSAINGVANPRKLYTNNEAEKVRGKFKNTAYFKSIAADVAFETMLERSQTTAFMVLQNDTILYENYSNGFHKDSIFTSFSVAKSFVSTLVGLAIADGFIQSENDSITNYLPELVQKDARFSNITISDLLSMSSGIAYSHDGFPSDDDITYQSPDLRSATLNYVQILEEPGKHWLYNNYNLLLLGLILERTTGMSVSKYAEEKLWKKMGGNNASWSIDEYGFEKMESGINCSIYDYARFALLFLNEGKYDNLQVLPENWIIKATQPQNKPQGYYDGLLKHNVYYSYFWWGKLRDGYKNTNDFFAMGNKGEYIYVCPQKKLIIIRFGFEYGFTPGSLSWPTMFYEFATNF